MFTLFFLQKPKCIDIINHKSTPHLKINVTLILKSFKKSFKLYTQLKLDLPTYFNTNILRYTYWENFVLLFIIFLLLFHSQGTEFYDIYHVDHIFPIKKWIAVGNMMSSKKIHLVEYLSSSTFLFRFFCFLSHANMKYTSSPYPFTITRAYRKWAIFSMITCTTA